MRGSNSLSRLPPIKVSVDNSTLPVPGSIASNFKQHTPSASPFSTPALISRDISQSRPTSNSREVEQPHTASGHEGPLRASSYWASKFQSQSKAEFVRGDVTPLLDRFEDTMLYRKPQRKSLQTVLDEMNAVSGRILLQRTRNYLF
ncbi:hypothetical protein GQ600_23467 [Phytophthora cactorum]|nr:hypothetical protein GQ600_23467 [Phytophthora cactorum]